MNTKITLFTLVEPDRDITHFVSLLEDFEEAKKDILYHVNEWLNDNNYPTVSKLEDFTKVKYWEGFLIQLEQIESWIVTSTSSTYLGRTTDLTSDENKTDQK